MPSGALNLNPDLAVGALAGAAGTAAMDLLLTCATALPLARVYQPIWECDARTLGEDPFAHLVFGTATGAAFAALTREEP